MDIDGCHVNRALIEPSTLIGCDWSVWAQCPRSWLDAACGRPVATRLPWTVHSSAGEVGLFSEQSKTGRLLAFKETNQNTQEFKKNAI